MFGSGGGEAVAEALTRITGAPVPLLGQIPIDLRLREGGDAGRPARAQRPGFARGPAAPARSRRAWSAAAAWPGGSSACHPV